MLSLSLSIFVTTCSIVAFVWVTLALWFITRPLILWMLAVISFTAAAVSVILLARSVPILFRFAASFFIIKTRFLIFSKVLLKYSARSPTSSFETTGMLLVRSPSPSEISLKVSATLTIGFVVLWRVKYIITAEITMAIAARMSVNRVIWFTSFKMYDFADASIIDHDLPELPIGKDSIISSTSVFKTGA